MSPLAQQPLNGSPSPSDESVPLRDAVSLMTVCAWCGRPMGRGPSSSRRIVSHGICRSCSDEVLFSDTPDLLPRR